MRRCKMFDVRWMMFLLFVGMLNVQRLFAQNDAMFVYRNDGVIHGFLKADIDSIRHSPLDLDSVMHAENVTQEVWTVDSVYRIPLAAIDSVSFVTPPTVYKDDVTRLEYNLLDYIIGADGLTLKLKPDTPTLIIPIKDDKLVLLEGCDALPYGFSGIVSHVEQGSSSIDVVCEQAYLEDLFDSFCNVTTAFGCNPDSLNAYSPSSRRRVTYSPKDIVFSLGPYKISESEEVSQGLLFVGDLALKGGTDFTVEIQPTFRIHTFLMLSLLHGVNFNCSITGDLRVASQTSFYGGLKYNHDFDGLTIPFPIPMTAGLINFYINPGLFLRADATISSNIRSTQVYTLHTAFDNRGNNQNTMNLDVRLAKSSFDAFGCLDGSMACGAYIEYGFNLLSRKIARVCLRGEFGGRFSGNFMLLNSDIVNAAKETKLYEKLKTSNVEFGRFVSSSLQASVWNTTYSLTSELYKPIRTWDLVPTFSGTTLMPTPGYPASLDAYTKLSGNCLFSVPYGFKLFDGNMNEVRDYDANSSYKDTECEMDYRFMGLDESKPYNYKVYPTVNFFGTETLAEPSAETDIGITPVTLKVSDVTETTAIAWGRIDGYELLDETMKFGLAYQIPESTETHFYPASSIDAEGVFSVEFKNLKPNTEYRYYAYLEIKGLSDRFEGRKYLFTTDVHREPYLVWDNANKTATYYYDDKCISRGGTIISEQHGVHATLNAITNWSDNVLSIIFDSSFSRYYPKSFQFNWCDKLQTIRNLNYLNTDSITSMSAMFGYCSSLTSLDLSSFNTSNVTSMEGMFYCCSSLKNLNLRGFNTSNVTSIGSMFYCCSSLTVLDLSSFKFNTPPWIGATFLSCESLKTIYAGDWHQGGAWDPGPFMGCTSLIGGKGTKLGDNYGYDENGEPYYYNCKPSWGALARIDGGKDRPGLFTAK